MANYFGEPGADIGAPVASDSSSLYSGQTYGGGGGKTTYSKTGYSYPGASNLMLSGYGKSYKGVNRGGGPATEKLQSQTTTSTPVAPDMAIPTLGGVPAIDKERMAQLSQERSAAGRRTLRRGMREAIQFAQQGDNANVASMVTRQALEGYGEGLGQVMGGAQKQAMSEVEYERGLQWQRTQAVFQAAMADYMQRFGTTQTTENEYGNSQQVIWGGGGTFL